MGRSLHDIHRMQFIVWEDNLNSLVALTEPFYQNYSILLSALDRTGLPSKLLRQTVLVESWQYPMENLNLFSPNKVGSLFMDRVFNSFPIVTQLFFFAQVL